MTKMYQQQKKLKKKQIEINARQLINAMGCQSKFYKFSHKTLILQ